MKHLKMEVGLLEPVKRSIFYHPDDRYLMNQLIKSADIQKIETKWMSLNHCVITPDIEVKLEIETRAMTTADFINNEFTVVCTNYFI